MCFKQPDVKVPDAPIVPDADAEAAKSRRAGEMAAAEQQQGRAATIITTPLGAQDYGKNLKRTTIGGM